MNLTRTTHILLILTGLVFFTVFFLIKKLGGDIGEVYWHFRLARVHLSHEWGMPYFTPGRCGGFLLAADPQDFLFTLYMLMTFFIVNINWAIKITTFLLSVVLVSGFYQWLKYFAVENKTVRLFAALLVSVSGYWVIHLTKGGHIWGHGFAYTPWIMVLIEELLGTLPSLTRRYLWKLAALSGLFFFLINSGYYWLQVAVPMIGMRILVELFSMRGRMLSKIPGLLAVAGAGIFALLLSFPRLGGIYAFQLTKFPRWGGSVSPSQVIGDNLTWLTVSLSSFFDARLVDGTLTFSNMGQPWDYNNFIGLFSVVPLIIGLCRIKSLCKSRSFVALFLAGLFQIGMTRTTHVSDVLRTVLPIYKQITWFWRGSGILIFLAVVLVAAGYIWILERKGKGIVLGAVALMFLNLFEIGWVQGRHIDLRFEQPVSMMFKDAESPADPLETHYYPCCVENIFGYGNKTPPVISIALGSGHSVYDVSPDGGPEYYNMHDVRRLFGPEADDGYFLTHDWPLWPKSDSVEFQKFIRYRQVVPLPGWLGAMNKVSAVLWGMYLLGLICLSLGRPKNLLPNCS